MTGFLLVAAGVGPAREARVERASVNDVQETKAPGTPYWASPNRAQREIRRDTQ